MTIEDCTINKCIYLIKDIEKKYGKDIFKQNQKRKFIGIIKDFTESDYDSKNLLLQLIDADVFIYLNKHTKRKGLFYILSSKILEDNGCTKRQINNFIYSFGLNNWQENKARNKKFMKLLFLLIPLFSVSFIIIAFLINYKSYYRTAYDKLVRGGDLNIQQYSFHLDNYFISKTEITEKEYYLIMNDIETDSQLPITQITWYDAINFCNRKSEIEKLEQVYSISDDNIVTADFSKNGYRLPTKLEWYWAAISRSNKNKPDYAGILQYGQYDYYQNQHSIIDEISWYIENSNEEIHPVASKKANKLGLFDMTGNVSELCWDNYWEIANLEMQSEYNNYKGPEENNYKTLMGGFFGNSQEQVKLINTRKKIKPTSKEVYVGFRVARSYKRKSTSE